MVCLIYLRYFLKVVLIIIPESPLSLSFLQITSSLMSALCLCQQYCLVIEQTVFPLCFWAGSCQAQTFPNCIGPQPMPKAPGIHFCLEISVSHKLSQQFWSLVFLLLLICFRSSKCTKPSNNHCHQHPTLSLLHNPGTGQVGNTGRVVHDVMMHCFSEASFLVSGDSTQWGARPPGKPQCLSRAVSTHCKLGEKSSCYWQ